VAFALNIWMCVGLVVMGKKARAKLPQNIQILFPLVRWYLVFTVLFILFFLPSLFLSLPLPHVHTRRT
jgi:hypothetical protein